MKVLSHQYDARVKADNVLVEMSIDEYLAHARKAIDRNEFQRKRVQGSRSIYSQLKDDLLQGCIIPPIVLATPNALKSKKGDIDLNAIQDSLLILDGLQRTYTLIELVDQLRRENREAELENVLELRIRAEIYFGANKSAVLYRMLTLNTGQTPMSLRQQLEMLYLDYLDAPIGALRLIKETDSAPVVKPNEYSFRDVIDGFNSYIERDELTLDRADLLENIKNLEALSKNDSHNDLFADFLTTFHYFLKSAETVLGQETTLPEIYTEQYGVPWGESVQKVFKRSQVITGFGAAIGKLQDKDLVSDFIDVKNALEHLKCTTDAETFLAELNNRMLDLKKRAKKIGNSQRLFFSYYFRELLNPQTDWCLDLSGALHPAYQKFESQTF